MFDKVFADTMRTYRAPASSAEENSSILSKNQVNVKQEGNRIYDAAAENKHESLISVGTLSDFWFLRTSKKLNLEFHLSATFFAWQI